MNHQTSFSASKKRFFDKPVLVSCFILLMIPTFFTTRELFLVVAQVISQDERQIGHAKFPKEPVEIVGLANSEREFSVDEKFEQKSDWLRNFTVQLKNNSNKPITFIAWQLEFPETTSSGDMMTFLTLYGEHPLRKPEEYENEPPIPANGVLKQRLNDNRYERLKTFILRRHKLDDLRQVNVHVIEIRYDDGTGWSNGPTKRDPKNPDRFVPTDRNEK